MSLAGCAEEVQHRLIHLFSRDENGRRAVNGGNPKLNRDPHFRDYVHFFEVSFSQTDIPLDEGCPMETVVAVSVQATRLDGQVWWLGVSCKLANIADFLERPEVRLHFR